MSVSLATSLVSLWSAKKITTYGHLPWHRRRDVIVEKKEWKGFSPAHPCK